MFTITLVSDQAYLGLYLGDAEPFGPIISPRNPLITRTFRTIPHSVRVETRNLMQ